MKYRENRLCNDWDLQDDYINIHLALNMLFLLDQDWKTNVAYNFIGDLKNVNNDITQIINPLIIDHELKHDATELFEYFDRIKKTDLLQGRQSESYVSEGRVLSRYDIDKSQ